MNDTETVIYQCPGHRTLDLHYVLTNGVVVALCFFLGTIGNLLTIFVLTRKNFKAKINDYFISLSLWDLALVTASFLLYTCPAWIYGYLPEHGPTVYSTAALYPLSNLARVGSVWTLMALAVERFLALAYPLKHQVSFTRGRMRLTLGLVALLAALFCLPNFLEVQITNCIVLTANNTNYTLEPLLSPTWLRLNEEYFIAYHMTCNSILVLIGPFFTQIGLAWKISRLLKRSLHQCSVRKKSSARESLETSMSRMLVVVEGKFLLCFVLPVVTNACELLWGQEAFNSLPVFGYLVEWSNLMVVVSSSVNFFIYLRYCPRFRGMLLRRVQPDRSTRELSGHSGQLLSTRKERSTLEYAETSLRAPTYGSPSRLIESVE